MGHAPLIRAWADSGSSVDQVVPLACTSPSWPGRVRHRMSGIGTSCAQPRDVPLRCERRSTRVRFTAGGPFQRRLAPRRLLTYSSKCLGTAARAGDGELKVRAPSSSTRLRAAGFHSLGDGACFPACRSWARHFYSRRGGADFRLLGRSSATAAHGTSHIGSTDGSTPLSVRLRLCMNAGDNHGTFRRISGVSSSVPAGSSKRTHRSWLGAIVCSSHGGGDAHRS